MTSSWFNLNPVVSVVMMKYGRGLPFYRMEKQHFDGLKPVSD